MAQIKRDVDRSTWAFAAAIRCAFCASSARPAQGEVAVLGNTTSTDEGILKVMGTRRSMSSRRLVRGRSSYPDNKKFVAASRHFKHDPGFYTAGPNGVLMIEAALKTSVQDQRRAGLLMRCARPA